MDGNALMKYTYTQFPYYAINSTTAERLLSADQLGNVNALRPVMNETVLFTIGYEGVSLEAYLNKLIRNDIKVLVDVRNNPLSQKFGFSKSQLIKYCEALHITYKKKTLPKTIPTQKKILALLRENKRIALTCFEADICQCHRKHLADAIVQLPDWTYALKHI